MKIQIYGYFNSVQNSISIVAANWIRVLSEKYDIRVQDYSGLDCRFDDIRRFLNKHKPPAPLGIYFGYPSYMKTSGNIVSENKFRVGVFVTETDLKGTEFDYLNSMAWSKICVPSAYCQMLYRKQCTSPIMVVNHGVEHPKFDNRPPKRNVFTFLYIFTNSPTGGSIERKNLRVLLEAFKLLYMDTGEKVRLIIKTSSNIPEDVPTLEKAYPGVMFELKCLTKRDLFELYHLCHVYVNPTKAEGFGLTPLEAMACGIPVVSPIHTGLTEFLSESNCIPIQYNRQVDHYRYATNDGKIWAVDTKNVFDSMKEAYTNYELHSKRAEMQKQYIQERFSWKSVLKEFMAWVDTTIIQS